MRRFAILILGMLLAVPAGAQQRKIKLDSLGLPPFPGANNVGHISLPLKDILKPKPGEHPTGPNLTDLAIQTYRTPLTTTMDRIGSFYLKYAQQGGWRLLDDIPDGSQNRSLVFWSPSAPGYLTVEVLPGPENTRQIDLTRLLGDVNPSRPGEVVKLTGKRIREQRVEVKYLGRFLDLKSGKLNRETLAGIEERSESGLPPTAAVRVAPMGETYVAVVTATDATKHMTSVDVYTANNTLVAHAESRKPTGTLTLLAKVRGTQGLSFRVVVMGLQDLPSTRVKPKPATMPAVPKPVPAMASAKKSTAKPSTVSAAKPAPKAALPAKAAPAPAPLPPPVTASVIPPPPPVVLTEWYGLRPALCGMPEAHRGLSTSKTESVVLDKDVEVGPTCDERKTSSLPWHTDATDEFSFSPDLFGTTLQRGQIGTRTGTIPIEFPLGSGTSNTYTVTETRTTMTTEVQLGYGFNGQWVTLPAKKENPTKTTYVVKSGSQPTVTKKSTGACPPK